MALPVATITDWPANIPAEQTLTSNYVSRYGGTTSQGVLIVMLMLTNYTLS